MECGSDARVGHFPESIDEGNSDAGTGLPRGRDAAEHEAHPPVTDVRPIGHQPATLRPEAPESLATRYGSLT